MSIAEKLPNFVHQLVDGAAIAARICERETVATRRAANFTAHYHPAGQQTYATIRAAAELEHVEATMREIGAAELVDASWSGARFWTIGPCVIAYGPGARVQVLVYRSRAAVDTWIRAREHAASFERLRADRARAAKTAAQELFANRA